MTLSVLIGGVEYAGSLRLEDGLQSVTAAADGSMSDSGIKIDDPNGSITILQWATVVITESACSQPRCFTGHVYKATTQRGPYLVGAGRVWVLEIVDLNGRLKLRAFHANSAKRPEETVTERMDWLMGSVGMSGLVYDNGFIGATSDTFTVGPRDYRQDGYAIDVLDDCVVVSRVFFVYWDASAMQASLFFETPDTAIKNSTLKLSNVLSDIDETTTFFAYLSPDLLQDGEDLYDGVVYNYPGGIIYRQLASTYATYGIHRDGRVNTDRQRTAARASQQVDEFLSKHSGTLDTITCTVRLPPSKVNLIEAGDRIQVKFSHLPGFSSFTWTRVTRRTFTFTPGTNEFYDVQLELSLRGLDQRGGGDPGVLPSPPPPAPVHWWTGSLTIYGDCGPDIPADTQAWSFPNGQFFENLKTYNYHFAWTDDGHLYAREISIQYPYTCPLNTGLSGFPHTGGPDTFLPFVVDGSFTVSDIGHFNPATEVYVSTAAAAGPHDHLPHGTLTFWVDPDGWDTGTPLPPATGTWVYNELVTLTAGAGTTEWPFADGSLKVRYDIIDQTPAIVSYNGATGAFVMPSQPPLGTQTFVDYQGR